TAAAPFIPPRRPISPFFPYTTLFRSEVALRGRAVCSPGDPPCPRRRGAVAFLSVRRILPRPLARGEPCPSHRLSKSMPTRRKGRSEEHTSELQSLAYLVCRLLLEKKK